MIKDLIAELKQIHSRDDLPAHAANLQRLFSRLVDVIIEAKKHKEVHTEVEAVSPSPKEYRSSDQLRIQLNRVLHMEGGREVVEKVQEEAINRLDAFEGLNQ